MTIKENEPLGRHTTLRTGGPARFFVEAVSERDVREAIVFAQNRRLPVLVLGGGSNVLAGDGLFEGLVVKVAIRGRQTNVAVNNTTGAVAEAGEDWDEFVAFTVAKGLHGLENMSLIPGTVGAAVVGNIGAYGAEIKDTLRWAEALDRRTGAVRRFAAGECAFGYRHSFFKTPEGRNFVVLRAAFGLCTDGPLNTTYPDVTAHFAEQGIAEPNLGQVREAVVAIRRRKLPDVACCGTAGSFFRNPVIPVEQYKALAARHPGLPSYPEAKGLVKVPLGWILDKICGLKGVRRGRVGTHASQALVIVNEGGTAAEVEALALELAEAVRKQTGLAVQWEVERVGCAGQEPTGCASRQVPPPGRPTA